MRLFILLALVAACSPTDGTDDPIVDTDAGEVGDTDPTADTDADPDTDADAPNVTGLSIEPAAPTSSDAITATWDAVSDASIQFAVSWTVDGADAGIAEATVPAEQLARGEVWEVSVRAVRDAVEGPAATASVTILDSPPELRDVRIEPDPARRGQPLAVLFDTFDADGDAVDVAITWTLDGDVVSQTATVEGDFTRGSVLVVRLEPSANGVAGSVVERDVEIMNTPPSIASVLIAPTTVRVGQEMTCTANVNPDPDGDEVTVEYTWIVDNQPVGTGANFNAPARQSSVRCVAEPFDGTDTGPTVSSPTVVVLNTGPTVHDVVLGPVGATVLDQVSAEVFASDPDGDAITYFYTFTVDFVPVPASQVTLDGNFGRLPVGAASKGQTVRVSARASDGESTTPFFAADPLVIANAPPAIVELTLTPEIATAAEPIIAVAEVVDPDDDPLTVTYTWSVNGDVVQSGPSATLEDGFERDDLIAVTLVAFDGDAEVSMQATVEVANAAPTVDSVVIEGPGFAGPPLICVAQASDADEDPLTLTYVWTLNGVEDAETSNIFDTEGLPQGSVIGCAVTADDGDALSEPVSAANRTIGTAPPTIDSVALSPEAPTRRDTLTATPGSTSTPTGTISYLYAWFADDAPIPDASAATLDVAPFPRGTVIRVEVRAEDDGNPSGPGEPAVDEVVVANTPPQIAVALDPAAPSAAGPVLALVDVDDPDDDNVSLTYVWTVGGIEVQSGTNNALDGSLLERDEQVAVAVTADDGEGGQDVATASATVVNAPPSQPVVRLVPELPREGIDLRCDIDVPSTDPDGDIVTYTITWTLNGAPASGIDGIEPNDTIPGEDVLLGDLWACEVVATDGDLSADPALASGLVQPDFPRVLLDAGTYTRGSPTSERGRTAGEVPHEVTLGQPFEIFTTEVTVSAWHFLMGTDPSGDLATCPDCPVSGINWLDALALANEVSALFGDAPCYDLSGCSGLPGLTLTCAGAIPVLADGGDVYACEGFRLPTEAEWEYAARSAGTVASSFPSGGDLGAGDATQCGVPITLTNGSFLDDQANYCLTSLKLPVASLTPNAVGLYDMAGNAEEWTWDVFGDYPVSTDPLFNPAGPGTGTSHVLRGGRWDVQPRFVRSAYRRSDSRVTRRPTSGVRLVRTFDGVILDPVDPVEPVFE